ncbi:hypothetical protein TNCV_1865621 [Trichonephila clavipes]|nr:hypothetical protein TNCV_1865621 [Trichonephila clavipes]
MKPHSKNSMLPLKLLQPLISVPKPTMSSGILTITKSSVAQPVWWLRPSACNRVGSGSNPDNKHTTTTTKSSTSTQAHLLPSTSSVAATSSESQPHIPLIDTAPATSISSCTSVASSSSNKALSSSTVSTFSVLQAETSSVLETIPPRHPIPYLLYPKLQNLAGKSVLAKLLTLLYPLLNQK